MIDYVRKQIRKIRAEKGLSQKSLSTHFKISQGTISKAESGSGKLDIRKLAEIANALEVDITEFFPKSKTVNKVEEDQKKYGFANKSDIDELTFVIKQLRTDIASLKKEITTLKLAMSKKKK